jgi:NADPH:quinone reductase-like Zn-dependent oxidoreductase
MALVRATDNAGRRVVVSERANFPTDLYIAQSLCQQHGFTLQLVEPDEIAAHLDERLGVLMLTHVNYRTGRMHDMAGVTRAAHACGALTLWDLAHSAGAVEVDLNGADADFVAVQADELAPKPATATHAEAAAVPLSALTAWQALFDQGDLDPGHRVLVHGGGGGVGSFAVQLARWRGAHVTATSSARDADFVRGLGADDVIDYRSQRFEDMVADVDLVFDTVGGDTWERSWDVLGPRGRLVSIAVPRPPERATDDGRRAIWFIVKQDREQLLEIGGLIDAGHLRPIVSAELPLARGQEVYGPTGIRSGPGKVVLLVAGVSGTDSETSPLQHGRPAGAVT